MFDENYEVPTKPPLYLFEGTNDILFNFDDFKINEKLIDNTNPYYSFFLIKAYEGPDGIDWDRPWDLKSSSCGMKQTRCALIVFILNFVITINFTF